MTKEENCEAEKVVDMEKSIEAKKVFGGSCEVFR
jgi:hypothetical protein